MTVEIQQTIPFHGLLLLNMVPRGELKRYIAILKSSTYLLLLEEQYKLYFSSMTATN